MPGRATTNKGAHEAECNCESCSAAAKSPRAVPLKGNRVAVNEALSKCRPTCTNIIRRNKRAVKILSQQVRAEKKLNPPCDPRYDSLRLFPTAKCAKRLSQAYAQARESVGSCMKKEPPPSVDPELIEIVAKRRDCACELMARAIRGDLHRHMGLANRRDDINAGTVGQQPRPEPQP